MCNLYARFNVVAMYTKPLCLPTVVRYRFFYALLFDSLVLLLSQIAEIIGIRNVLIQKMAPRSFLRPTGDCYEFTLFTFFISRRGVDI